MSRALGCVFSVWADTFLQQMHLLIQFYPSLAKLKHTETTMLLVRWDTPIGGKNCETQ